jgi:hypothetical protein
MAWLAAPLLLAAVGLLQILLAHQAGLSPWLGGGFGMFATIDSRSERHLVVFADSPGLIRELEIPESLEEEAERVRALPTEARMRSLARNLVSGARHRLPGLSRVRIQLWRTTYEPGTLARRDRLARELILEASEIDG